MDSEISAWLDAQITDCSLNADAVGAVSRLVEAGAGLNGRKPQLFGMALSRFKFVTGEKQAYRERIRDLLRRRLAELEPENSAQVLEEIRRMSLDEWLGLPPEVVPEPTHRITVRFRVSIVDSVTDEPIFDLETLRSLDGIREGDRDWDSSYLHEIPCLEEIIGSLVGSRFLLRLDASSEKVFGDLELLSTRDLSRQELAQLSEVAEEELLYSGWGLNMEFSLPNEIRLLVEPEVAGVWSAAHGSK